MTAAAVSPTGLFPDPDRPPAAPYEALAAWLPPLDAPGPTLCTLATVDEQGRPDARTLMLSGWDREGLALHTSADSHKTAELAAHPWATVVLAMPEQARQLVVSGPVERQTREEEIEAYRRRPRYLQLLAWLNTEQTAGLPLAERRRAWAEFDAAHPVLAAPDGWIGHRIRYHRVVFWQGSTDCPSIRLDYRREGEDWSVTRMPG